MPATSCLGIQKATGNPVRLFPSANRSALRIQTHDANTLVTWMRRNEMSGDNK
jgi:hypothetical protein